MMIEVERKFINQFVVKNRRQRLSCELWGKCRQQGIERFCHNTRELLIESKIKARGKELHEKTLQSMLPSCYNGQDCYIMAYHETIDGTVCSYEEALKLVLGNGMAAIIIYDGFAVVETEQYVGSAQKFVLCNGKS